MGINATNTKSPCFNCSNRSMTCHSDCKRYLLYKKECDSQRETIQKAKKLESLINGMAIDGIRRSTKARHGIVGQR